MKPIRLYKWTLRDAQHGNFGDEISVPLIEQLFGRAVVTVSPERAELLAAGSVLDTYHLKMIRRSALHRALRRWQARRVAPAELAVWGTGTLFGDGPLEWPQRTLRVTALRGALTAARLGGDAVPLGDPGILASLLVRAPSRPSSAVAVVPNHVDTERLARIEMPRGWVLVDPTMPVRDVLAAIAGAELVVSSSLHGLITADSYGVPSVWMAPQGRISGSQTHKYLDYASARACPLSERVTLSDAFELGFEGLAMRATVPGRGMSDWQKELVAAFPFL